MVSVVDALYGGDDVARVQDSTAAEFSSTVVQGDLVADFHAGVQSRLVVDRVHHVEFVDLRGCWRRVFGIVVLLADYGIAARVLGG